MSTSTDVGTVLLELQELDLKIERNKKTLGSLPELSDLAKLRKARQRLKTESTKLYARRKDLESDLSDLDDEERDCRADVDRTQAVFSAGSGYREVQDAELKLAELSKQLEKIEYRRGETRRRLDELTSQEDDLAATSERVETSLDRKIEQARAHASALQREIHDEAEERDALAASLPPEMLDTYTAALERFDGLAVEKLEGSVPSVCRTTLAPAQLSDLRRKGSVTTCPYCHRIIIISTGEEAQ